MTTIPFVKDRSRSRFTSREAVDKQPQNFTFDDPGVPVHHKKEAIEERFKVLIEEQPTRFVVYGPTRISVSDAVRELLKVCLFDISMLEKVS